MAKKKKQAKKTPAAGKPRTKTEIFKALSESTELTRKQVVSVFDGLGALIKQDLGKRGPGVLTVPGLLKLKRVNTPLKLVTRDSVSVSVDEPSTRLPGQYLGKLLCRPSSARMGRHVRM